MYNEIPARDTFGDLEIIPSVRKNDTTIQNYLVLPRNKNTPSKIIIQSYKTIARYGIKNIQLTTELSSIIRKYILCNSVTTKLFPNNSEGLTQVISKMNNKINVSGGINTIRKIYVPTTLANKDISPTQRINLASDMMHSPIMNLNDEGFSDFITLDC